MGLQWRITAAVAAGVVVLFLIFGYAAWQTIERSSQAAMEERQSMARVVAHAIDVHIHEATRRLEQVAALPITLQGLSNEQLQTLELMLNGDGTFIRILRVQGDAHPTPGPLESWPDSQGVPITEEPGVLEAMRADRPSVLYVLDPPDWGQPIALVIVPVHGPEGKHLGAVAGEIDLTPFVQGLASASQSGHSGIAVVDRTGIVLTTSMNSPPGQPERHAQLMAPFLQTVEAGVKIHRPGSGPNHVVAFVPLTSLPGGVIVENRQDLVLDISQHLRQNILIYGSIALVIACIAAWLHVRQVVRPIRQLTAATERITQGVLDKPLSADRTDELGLLASRFESMRQSLQEARQEQTRWEWELEHRVEARTQEVHVLLGKVITAQEEERRRVAREIHDGMAQELATLLLALQSVTGSLPEASRPQQKMLERTVERIEQAMKGLWDLMLDLRPSALDDLGLVAAVREYALHRLEGTRMRLDFHIQGEPRPLGSARETAVFRILQEAISNAVRHSEGRLLQVQLDFRADGLRAAVEDNGVGFDPSAFRQLGAQGRGWGLMGMRERTSLIGGTLDMRTSPHGGTRVELNLSSVEEWHGDRAGAPR